MALVELEEFTERIYADLAAARLAAAGIETQIFDGGLASLGLGPIIPARLMVHERDEERARQILDEPGEEFDKDFDAEPDAEPGQ